MAVNPLQPTIPFTLTPSIQNAERSQQDERINQQTCYTIV